MAGKQIEFPPNQTHSRTFELACWAFAIACIVFVVICIEVVA